MTTTSVLSLAALLGLGGACVGLYVQNRDLSARVDDLSGQMTKATERAAASGRAEGSGPTLEGPSASKAEVADLRRSVESLGQRVAKQEQHPAAAGAGGPGAAAMVRSAEFEEGVRAVLDRVQEEPGYKAKVQQAAGKPAIEKKPTFAALAQFLALDSSQETSFRHDLEDIQGELMARLAEQRPDGRVLLEEIQKAEALPVSDPKRAEIFMDLFKLKIPGTEQTYVEKAMALALSFRKKADAYLRPEQREKLSGVDVDLFGVKMN